MSVLSRREALRHYNSAIEIDGSEDNVSAVLYSNRGACNFYLARYMDCIYDCTLSMSYDPSYHR